MRNETGSGRVGTGTDDASDLVVLTGADLLFAVDGVAPTGGPDSEITGHVRLDERHTGPDDRTAVGALGVLVDEVLGYSLMKSLPPGSWTISTEIWIDVVAPLPRTGTLTGLARTVQVGSFAVGGLSDADGQLVVECRERGRRIADVPDLSTYRSPSEPPAYENGLAETLGLVLDEPSHLVVTPTLANPRHVLHGGVSLAAAELAATAARLRDGCELATSSLHCVHARAVPAGAKLQLRTATVHAGRSLWITDVTGTVDGRTAVVARVSAQ